jgi:hypothetical protein
MKKIDTIYYQEKNGPDSFVSIHFPVTDWEKREAVNEKHKALLAIGEKLT